MSRSARTHENRSVRIVGALVLGAAVCVGLYARLAGLGERPLAVDEYYFLTSVQQVLATGVPELPGGGYYTRGLIVQYLSALLVGIIGDPALAGRLFAVLCNLACVGALFLYARLTVGRELAWLPPALLLVSSWEIEFARFARMYAPFQLVSVLFFWSLQRSVGGGGPRWRYLPHVLAVIANLTHALGLLLLPLLFVPLLLPRPLWPFETPSRAIRYAAVTAVFLAAVLAFDQLNLGRVENPYPEGYAFSGYAPLRLPPFPFWSLADNRLINLLGYGIAITAAGGAALAFQLARRRDPAPAVLAAMTVASGALHQFVPAALGALIVVARFFAPDRLGAPAENDRNESRRWVAATLIGVGLAGSIWGGVALGTTGWLERLAGEASSLPGAMRRVFFGWPDFYEPVVLPWLRDLPNLGLLLLVSVSAQLVIGLRGPIRELVRNPALVVLYVIATFGVLNTIYATTRYAFFVYPLALTCVVMVAAALVRLIPAFASSERAVARVSATTLLTFAAFGATADFQPAHWVEVREDQVSYRLGRYEPFSGVWYPRSDYATPAEYVGRTAGLHESVIVVAQPPVSHYIDREHAVYYDRGDPRFANVSRERGTRDRWSAQRLLSTAEELRRFTAESERVWLVWADAVEERPFVPQEVWGTRWSGERIAFVSRDGRVQVVEVGLKTSP